MFIIFNDDRNVVAIYTDRARAILARNFLEYKSENTHGYEILEYTGKIIDENVKDNDRWEKDIDLTDKPLDFKVDLTKNVNANNFIHAEIENEKNEKIKKEIELQNCLEFRKRTFHDAVNSIRSHYADGIQSLWQEVNSMEVDLDALHKDLVIKKRMLKNNEFLLPDFKKKEEEKFDLRKNLGKKRASLTHMKKKYHNAIQKKIMEKNIHVYVYDFYDFKDMDDKNPLRVTIMSGSAKYVY